MQLIVANLSARYTGRSDTYLAPYNRILVVKADGAVAIHGEKGHKPMNYMMATAEKSDEIIDELRTLTFDSRNESLTVYLHEIYSEFDLALGEEDPGLVKDGTEHELQAWLAQNLSKVAPELTFVGREHPTGDGPVDILAEHEDGSLVAVEVKRVAPLGTVGQVFRYRNALREAHPQTRVEGMIAAVELKPKTIELAARRGIACKLIPGNWRETSDKHAARQADI